MFCAKQKQTKTDKACREILKFFGRLFCNRKYARHRRDTSVIWYISSVGVVLMSMPNLIGLLILHKELKEETQMLGK